MNIFKELKQWSRRRDGELSPAAARRLDARKTYPAWVEESLEAWASLGDRLRRQPIPTPPAEAMWNDVRRAIRLAEAQKREAIQIRFRWDWAVIAATLVLFVGVGLFGLRMASPPVALAAPRVEWVEVALPDAGTLVYEDESTGAVVIWVVAPVAGPSNGGEI